MILFVKSVLTCVIIFPFCQLYSVSASESDVTLVSNFSSLLKISSTDDCHFLLKSFADVSAKFTYCAISNARPITICQDCVVPYTLSVEVHKDILKLMDRGGELCKQKLLNLDRLQIVEGGFGFIYNLWKRAKCDSCYETGTVDHPEKLKHEINEILRLQNETNECIQTHKNDTEGGKMMRDPEVCYECKQNYLKLNAYYNAWEVSSPICMDIIDMINTTRQTWSVDLGCCLDRKNPDYAFLISSGFISILPVLFYLLACTFAGKKEHQVVLLRNRCSIPYPGYVPPTPSAVPPVLEEEIPACSSGSSIQVN